MSDRLVSVLAEVYSLPVPMLEDNIRKWDRWQKQSYLQLRVQVGVEEASIFLQRAVHVECVVSVLLHGGRNDNLAENNTARSATSGWGGGTGPSYALGTLE